MDLVASLSQDAKQPLESVNRRLHIAGLFICATLASVWSVHDFLSGLPCTFGVSRVSAAAVALTVGVVVQARRSTQRAFELGVTLGVTLWSAILVWGFAALEAEDLREFGKPVVILIMQMYVLFASLPLWSCIVFTVTHTANCVIVFHIVGHPVKAGEYMVVGVTLACVVVYVYHRRLGWRWVHQVLVAEQGASRALLASICDADIWLGSDGDRIVRSDKRFDMLMQDKMNGRLLSECLDEAEGLKFKRALLQSPDVVDSSPSCSSSRTQSPAQLVTVTLTRTACDPVRADLFIVAAGPALGYLIGIRRNEPDGPGNAQPRSTAVPVQSQPMPGAGVVYGRADVMPDRESRPSWITDRESRPSWIMEDGGIDFDSSVSGNVSGALSYPLTLASRPQRDTLQVQTCGRLELSAALLRAATRRSPQGVRILSDTLHEAIALCCDHAAGGALIAIATKMAFERVFTNERAFASADEDDEPAFEHTRSGPTLRTSDGGYMTRALRGLHVADERFASMFREFTQHSDTDRWPSDHPDASARDQPKDGALILDVSGYRLACASKVSGLSAPTVWPGVGTRHETAISCAWAVDGCITLVRSDAGTVHGAVRDGMVLKVYRLLAEEAI